MKTLLAYAALCSIGLQACAQPTPSPSMTTDPFRKSEWHVAGVSCPIGCSDFTIGFLHSLVGKSVTLGRATFDAPFVERCAGTLRYELHRAPPQGVVDDVNQGVSPTHQRMKPADLGLGTSNITWAIALCRSASGESSYQRILSIEDERVLVLFEEQSVIELR